MPYALGTGGSVQPPSISPNGDISTGAISVSISQPNDGSGVFYSTDGSSPGVPYGGPITVTGARLMMRRSAIVLGDKGDSESARLLRTSPPAGEISNGQIIVVYTPGGGHKFYEEFGPVARSGADRAVIAALFQKYDMTLLGAPLSPD